jgi:membrane protein CcdC involved in cytochrome C biogenesis
MRGDELSLDRWANFYIITSTAAATLIGLLFVVITLAAERRPKEAPKIRLYLTPTVVYFGSTLCLATLLTFPNHSPLTAALCGGLVGVVGILYSASPLVERGRKKAQYEHPSDMIQYVVIPVAAYGLLVLGGVLLLYKAQRGLTLVALGMFALLTLALRNSWSIAVDLVSSGDGSGNE